MWYRTDIPVVLGGESGGDSGAGADGALHCNDQFRQSDHDSVACREGLL